MKLLKSPHESIEVSIVFPVYNEVNGLKKAVKKTASILKGFICTFEIIIAEDGSTDGTDRVAASLSHEYSFIKHLHKKKRQGRGAALRNAFNQSRGEILVYMDADLATDIEQLKTLIKSIANEEFDVVIGSRLLSDSRTRRSRIRQLVSRLYNYIVRTILQTKIRDHQCGFKAFKREPLLQLLDEITATHWFWDTELLVKSVHRGYRIKEIPVNWKGQRETKVKLLSDSFTMGFQILKLWWQLRKQ